MTASDLHQRMLHLLDRVKAMDAPKPGSSTPVASANSPAGGHPTNTIPDSTIQTPHIPDMAIEPDFPDEMSTEDRIEARRKVLKKGVISYAAGNFKVECQIRDLNSKGAKLRLSGDVTVPSCFDLVIMPEKISQKAQVCWKDGFDLGIHFIETE